MGAKSGISVSKLEIDLMIKANSALKYRITAGDVKSVEAGKEGVPLEVEIRIK